MKKFLVLLSLLFCGFVHADTVDINWYVDDSVYDTSICTVGGDIVLPTTPTKRGYTFQGWIAYTPIEYIESTGTQWIDTGVSGLNTGNWQLYLKWMTISAPNPGYKTVFSAYTDEQSNTYRIIFNQSQTNYLLYGNSKALRGGATVSNVAINTIHELQLNNGYAILDDVRYNTPTTGNAISAASPIFIYGNTGQYRFYASWAKKDGVYMYDFIPVLDHNGVPCMFDRVSQTFFYGSGTDDFIAGPVINQ